MIDRAALRTANETACNRRANTMASSQIQQMFSRGIGYLVMGNGTFLFYVTGFNTGQ